MKKTIYIIAIALGATACSQPTSDWTAEQKQQWKSDCQAEFVSRAKDKADKSELEALCDCMLKVTSRDYSYADSKNLSEAQVEKQLQDCNYSW